MSENKKGPGSSLANSQGTNKSSNKLYHERNEDAGHPFPGAPPGVMYGNDL